jgi:hypothetical protein
MEEVEEALAGRADGRGHHRGDAESLGSVVRLDDGTVSDPPERSTMN